MPWCRRILWPSYCKSLPMIPPDATAVQVRPLTFGGRTLPMATCHRRPILFRSLSDVRTTSLAQLEPHFPTNIGIRRCPTAVSAHDCHSSAWISTSPFLDMGVELRHPKALSRRGLWGQAHPVNLAGARRSGHALCKPRTLCSTTTSVRWLYNEGMKKGPVTMGLWPGWCSGSIPGIASSGNIIITSVTSSEAQVRVLHLA